ncbi:MAG: alpha/beta hydrolase [Methylococcales bacterium]|nr:alpha/beta hydrolase [Methylococcales bacterium]
MSRLVIYNHGKDSMPWGEKPLALAEVARRHGYHFESLDYRPGNDPELRVEQLLAFDVLPYRHVVLAGSSMGGYVATVAAETINPLGLFLIAPAFYLPGYQRTEFRPSTANIEIFHGWRDTIVPPENVWRFSRLHRARLHMLDADHRLLSVLPQMAQAFERFLTA